MSNTSRAETKLKKGNNQKVKIKKIKFQLKNLMMNILNYLNINLKKIQKNQKKKK
jgi:hypothetical protein